MVLSVSQHYILLFLIQPKPAEVREWRGLALLFYISRFYSIAFLAWLKKLKGGETCVQLSRGVVHPDGEPQGAAHIWKGPEPENRPEGGQSYKLEGLSQGSILPTRPTS